MVTSRIIELDWSFLLSINTDRCLLKCPHMLVRFPAVSCWAGRGKACLLRRVVCYLLKAIYEMIRTRAKSRNFNQIARNQCIGRLGPWSIGKDIRKAPWAECAREDMIFQHSLRTSRLYPFDFLWNFTLIWWFNFFLAKIFLFWSQIGPSWSISGSKHRFRALRLSLFDSLLNFTLKRLFNFSHS